MTPSQKVTVSISSAPRAYDIQIGDGLLSQLGTFITDALGPQRRAIIVTDSRVGPLYLDKAQASLAAAGHSFAEAVIVPEGEASKSFAELERVTQLVLERRIDRNSPLIALGGGVIGDLGGLTATLVKRGIPIVQVPTTLLSQTDSSVGGKTAIDTPFGKNTIGAFTQPNLVVIDVATLDTLDKRQTLAGYGEVVKYGLINDAAFFEWCETNGAALIAGDRARQIEAVRHCCAAKAAIVAQDEHDRGDVRALLNLGHTFAHPMELVWDYTDKILHGEAVAIGCVMAYRLSAALGLCDPTLADRIAAHFASLGLPARPPEGAYNVDKLLDMMSQDKKAMGGQITLILTKGLGQAYVEKKAPIDKIREVWQSVIG